MKHFKWPRPPLVLGFILGEDHRALYVHLDPALWRTWMLRPLVIVLFAMSVLSLVRPFLQDVSAHGGWSGMVSDFRHAAIQDDADFPGVPALPVRRDAVAGLQWNFYARIIPTIVGTGAILFCTLSLVNDMFKRNRQGRSGLETRPKEPSAKKSIWISQQHHASADEDHFMRGVMFFGWMVFFLCSMDPSG